MEATVSSSPQTVRVNRTTGGCEQFRNIVEKYDWDTNTILAIMQAESGCNPTADNSGLNQNGTVDIGLLQINSIHGFSKAELTNPARNIAIAHQIWQKQDYKAWSAFNNKSYLKFL